MTSEDDSDGSSIEAFLDDRSDKSDHSSDLEEVAPIKLTESNRTRATRSSR